MGKYRTANNYELLECVSALQKCIRRGEIEPALFWAAEVETKFPDFLWVRLTVIANEDIGMASPETVILVESLRQQYAFLRKKSKSPSERLALANAIYAMCIAPKTRLADDLQTTVYRKRIFEGWRLEVPDVALDRHTRRGRTMGRGWDHWRREGCKLDHETEGLNRWHEEAHRLREQYGPLPKKGKGDK